MYEQEGLSLLFFLSKTVNFISSHKFSAPVLYPTLSFPYNHR